MELSRKPDNWRQIYKQTSSNDLSRRKIISKSCQGCEIAVQLLLLFLKYTEAANGEAETFTRGIL